MMVREGMMMMTIFVALLTIAVVSFFMMIAWSAVSEETTDDKSGPAKGSELVHETAEPETLEGVLVRQLLDGEINRLQYRRAMRRLAERDADRHPLAVPHDN